MTTKHAHPAGRHGPSGRTVILLEECKTPFGMIYLAATDRGLCRITVPGEDVTDLLAWVERRLPSADVSRASGALDSVAAALGQFFDGVPLPPMPVDLIGTAFQQAVWNAVLSIPYGETRSYADIARSIGHPLAGRAVGAANAANPLPFVVPCHRVIGADGAIKGYPGGIVTRRMLLEFEGVRLGRGSLDYTDR
jgi:methylated-DNA-[protein]-cysteine S-methyltransferase